MKHGVGDAVPDMLHGQRADHRSPAAGTAKGYARALARVGAAVFVISSAFPVAAGLSTDTKSFPRAWGVVDVSLAFTLSILAIAVVGVAQERVDDGVRAASYRAYRVLLHGILAACVLFFVMGDRIVWINCLTGFAWRAWLLLYCLPAWLAASRAKPAE